MKCRTDNTGSGPNLHPSKLGWILSGQNQLTMNRDCNEIATTITNNPQTLLSFCKNSKSKNEEFNKGTGSNGCKINRNILSIDNQVNEKIGTSLSTCIMEADLI